ncbi:MAG: cyclase family protein [Bacteroidales bacterium]|jgi:arylformamidase|nr:cyclase family protein [Bacteroidales bacterium]
MKILDISRELFASQVYPGDTIPSRVARAEMDKDGYRLSDVTLCAHNGTHVDAPSHFVPDGQDVSQIALEKCMGEVVVLPCKENITEKMLLPILLKYKPERILFKGSGYLTEEAARVLVKAKIQLVGTELLSIGHAEFSKPVHEILLGAEVVVIENLDLSAVAPGKYLLVALPLKWGRVEGAPCRAVLLPCNIL